METKFVILDKTNNTGKEFQDEQLQGVSSIDDAMKFDSLEDCLNFIKDKNLNKDVKWAIPYEVEILNK